MSVDVEGLAAVEKRLAIILSGLSKLKDPMKDATLLLTNSAKRNLNPWQGPGTGGADRGHLKASIMPKIQSIGSEAGVEGVVGSPVEYGVFQEHGSTPHYVPEEYIGTWAERHGLGYRGVFVSGTPLKFLWKAMTDNVTKVARIFGFYVAKLMVRGEK